MESEFSADYSFNKFSNEKGRERAAVPGSTRCGGFLGPGSEKGGSREKDEGKLHGDKMGLAFFPSAIGDKRNRIRTETERMC